MSAPLFFAVAIAAGQGFAVRRADRWRMRSDSPHADDTLFAAVIAAAVRAGAEILRLAAAGCTAHVKADGSPATDADLRAEALLLKALTSADPSTPIISEEHHVDAGNGSAPHRFWLVDPLDGTREFLAGRDDYTVNVALVEDGEPVLGVVHIPARGVTYAALRAGGARRIANGRVETIRACGAATMTVVASRSHPAPALRAFLAALPPHRMIALGSSLKLCLVADGTAQLYPRLGPTCWWDVAAADVIAREAGASVTTLDGVPLRYAGADVRNPPFVCSAVSRAIWAAAADAVA